MTTLENSYCVPKNSKEWKALLLCNAPMRNMIRMRNRGQIAFLQNTPLLSLMDADKDEFHFGDRKEIPVQHFIDLVEDRISAWRLEEIGFSSINGKFPYYEIKMGKRVTLSWSEFTYKNGIGFQLPDDDMWINVNTFTDLLTLIKFLTPP